MAKKPYFDSKNDSHQVDRKSAVGVSTSFTDSMKKGHEGWCS